MLRIWYAILDSRFEYTIGKTTEWQSTQEPTVLPAKAVPTVRGIDLDCSATADHIYIDFYNYLHHGVDVLLDGSTHLVKKIILHSNIVGVKTLLSEMLSLT